MARRCEFTESVSRERKQPGSNGCQLGSRRWSMAGIRRVDGWHTCSAARSISEVSGCRPSRAFSSSTLPASGTDSGLSASPSKVRPTASYISLTFSSTICSTSLTRLVVGSFATI